MPAYKDEKRGTWYAKFRYTDWTGASRFATKRGFTRKQEAKDYEAAIKRKASEMPDMTISELADRYLAAMKGRLKSSTFEDREGDIRNYILPRLGNIRLSKLTRATIAEWQSWLVAQPPRVRNKRAKCAPKEGAVIAPSTANAKNRVLVIMLNYAVRMEWMAKNPAAFVPRVGHRVQRLEFWEKSEYDSFIREADAKSDIFVLEFDILFYGGLRLAELRGLGGDSFDFARNEIKIRHAMNERGYKTGLKNQASYRSVSMPPSIMERIKTYVDSLYDVPEVGLFPYSARMLRKKMLAWSKAAGLPYIKLHGLRHSHVSHLINLGVPITAISRRIGHKNPQVTLNTYSHLYESDASNISGILEKSLNVGQMLVTEETKHKESPVASTQNRNML